MEKLGYQVAEVHLKGFLKSSSMEGGVNCVALILNEEKDLQFVGSWVTLPLKLFHQMHCKYKNSTALFDTVLVFNTDTIVAVMLLG